MKKLSKRPVVTFISITAVLGLGIFWLAWEMGVIPDCGLESGYYGQLNRVKHTIERMPNIRVVDHWMHEDISLEDFGFVLAVDDGRVVEVDFTEGSPEMAERSKVKIREFVERQIAMSSKRES